MLQQRLIYPSPLFTLLNDNFSEVDVVVEVVPLLVVEVVFLLVAEDTILSTNLSVKYVEELDTLLSNVFTDLMLRTKINFRIRRPWESILLMNPQHQSLSHKHILLLQRLSMMLHCFSTVGPHIMSPPPLTP